MGHRPHNTAWFWSKFQKNSLLIKERRKCDDNKFNDRFSTDFKR